MKNKFCAKYFFPPESHTVFWEKVEKYGVVGQGTDYNIIWRFKYSICMGDKPRMGQSRNFSNFFFVNISTKYIVAQNMEKGFHCCIFVVTLNSLLLQLHLCQQKIKGERIAVFPCQKWWRERATMCIVYLVLFLRLFFMLIKMGF